MYSKVFSVVLVLVASSLIVCVRSATDMPVPLPPFDDYLDGRSEKTRGNWDWHYDNITKTLTINGTGVMDDFQHDSSPWKQDYREEIEKVVVMDGITRIGAYSFNNLPRLLTIQLPESATIFGSGAFAECHLLHEINFPENLTYIGQVAFRTCKSLKSVYISPKITSVGDGAFSGCESLQEFDIDPLNEKFVSEDGLFITRDTRELRFFPAGRRGDYVVPENITKIGFGAFERSHLTSVVILGNVTYFPSSCFLCSELESITLPDSVTAIATQAFRECLNLKSFVLPANLVSLESGVFYYCRNLSFVSYYGPSDSNFSCTNAFSGCPVEVFCVPPNSKLSSFCGITNFCRSSSCEDIDKYRNKCYGAFCLNDEWMIEKYSSAVKWENMTNDCVEYKCLNDTGLFSTSKCTGADHVCMDDKCVSTKTTEKPWSVTIDINETLAADVDVAEALDTISTLCGVQQSTLKVALEINDDGYVVGVIILVDDESTAQLITSVMAEISKNETCGYGIFCENNGFRVKEIELDFQVLDGSERYSNNVIIMLVSMLLLLILFVK